eukprot:6206045-Pleurochrysis_carterae.AAC.3
MAERGDRGAAEASGRLARTGRAARWKEIRAHGAACRTQSLFCARLVELPEVVRLPLRLLHRLPPVCAGTQTRPVKTRPIHAQAAFKQQNSSEKRRHCGPLLCPSARQVAATQNKAPHVGTHQTCIHLGADLAHASHEQPRLRTGEVALG